MNNQKLNRRNMDFIPTRQYGRTRVSVPAQKHTISLAKDIIPNQTSTSKYIIQNVSTKTSREKVSFSLTNVLSKYRENSTTQSTEDTNLEKWKPAIVPKKRKAHQNNHTNDHKKFKLSETIKDSSCTFEGPKEPQLSIRDRILKGSGIFQPDVILLRPEDKARKNMAAIKEKLAAIAPRQRKENGDIVSVTKRSNVKEDLELSSDEE